VCCGTKRQVDIRCPESCGYLSSARSHPPAAVRRQRDRDMDAILPALAGLSEARQQLFLYTLTLVDRLRGDGLEAATDADAASAARALAETYETASRGLIYEHRADSLPGRRIAAGIREVYEELGRNRPSGFAADAAAVLRQLEDVVTSVQRSSPTDQRAFLGLAERLSAVLRPPGAPPAAGSGAGGPGSPIILP